MMNLSELQPELLTPKQRSDFAQAVKYRWSLIARPSQLLPPGDWTYWAIVSGRGFGKTRTGCETIRIWKENNPIMLLAGATAGDLRDIMIEGESGIMACSPPWDRPIYSSSKSRLTWKNGAMAFLRSADEPDRFRGLQFYKTWVDELAAWRYPEAWDQIQMGLRLGLNPQALITTTPRPIKILKDILSDPNTVITRGSSYENKANLSKAFFDSIIKKYEGTRLGRQEIDAEMLEDIEGALWTRALIDPYRVSECPELIKCVIPIDPAVTSKDTSDESGIIPVGMAANGHIYVLDDYSGIYPPKNLMTKAVTAYEKYRADKVIAEVNNGGELIKELLKQIGGDIPYGEVWASRGKVTRAEPVVMLYEQGRVHHVGSLPKLEDEMCSWDVAAGMKSPNRIDSLVWGVTYLTSGTEDSEWLF
jgi:phage terminase large subunit-like protein